MTKLTDALAERIASRMQRDGFDTCTAEDVKNMAGQGYVPSSVVGDDYDAALESRILQELEEYGIEV